MKKIIAFLAVFSALALNAQTVVKDVDAETFKKYLKEKNTVLIDLRTDEEIAKKGKIPGAVQIDYFGKDAEKQISQLDKSKTYLIYCAGGGRSSECGELMEKQGFKNIINLQKGFDDWKKKGFEVDLK